MSVLPPEEFLPHDNPPRQHKQGQSHSKSLTHLMRSGCMASLTTIAPGDLSPTSRGSMLIFLRPRAKCNEPDGGRFEVSSGWWRTGKGCSEDDSCSIAMSVFRVRRKKTGSLLEPKKNQGVDIKARAWTHTKAAGHGLDTHQGRWSGLGHTPRL